MEATVLHMRGEELAEHAFGSAEALAERLQKPPRCGVWPEAQAFRQLMEDWKALLAKPPWYEWPGPLEPINDPLDRLVGRFVIRCADGVYNPDPIVWPLCKAPQKFNIALAAVIGSRTHDAQAIRAAIPGVLWRWSNTHFGRPNLRTWFQESGRG